MDLRTLPPDLDPEGRCTLRRKRMEQELSITLPHLHAQNDVIGTADEKNCEQMIGCVSVPVGYAGPLRTHFSSGEERAIHLPLATTEAALVASVNRGCKALSMSSGVEVTSTNRGISRSLAFSIAQSGVQMFTKWLDENIDSIVQKAESTSSHLKVIHTDIDHTQEYVFLTLSGDTDEAMGMNMITIAGQAAGEWIVAQAPKEYGVRFVTVAGNVDSDKKPSLRTKQRGRCFDVSVQALIDAKTLREVLHASAEDMAEVAKAKLRAGSTVAFALGRNLHVANILAALYIATGQDAAHVVEGSLSDTIVALEGTSLRIATRIPAIIVGVRGGGTTLPSQADCLKLLLHPTTTLSRKQQLAESIGAAVLAGELSLLAAQATHTLASSHKQLAR